MVGLKDVMYEVANAINVANQAMNVGNEALREANEIARQGIEVARERARKLPQCLVNKYGIWFKILASQQPMLLRDL